MLPNKFQEESSSPPLGEPEGARLLVIGSVWPEPTTTAAGNRMLQLLETFKDDNCEIVFASTASKTKYSNDLNALGFREEAVQLNDSSFDVFVKGLKPDVVLFDRFMVEEQFGWRVAAHCPNALRILNTEDLHSLREFRETCIKNDLNFSISEYLKQDKTKREMASIYRSDLTLLVSSFEKELLESEVGIQEHLLLHLPFMLPKIVESTKESWPEFEERRDFISFGNGYHEPNVDSFRYLKQTIWPLIRKELPSAKLHIYGAYLPQQIKEMHQPNKGFLVHGWAEDLEEQVRRARVVLAPLRFGAGIKGKLTTAMRCGTPNITSHIGAEGMSGTLPWGGIVGDTPEELAKAAIELYQDKQKWVEFQNNGLAIINTVYHSVKLQKRLMNRLAYVTEHLDTHRNKNFMGTLLQHQTMAATKYMGKWIEEKNKFKK